MPPAAGRAGDSARGVEAALEAELRALVDSARGTLAEARRMVVRYREVSLRAELDTAAALLRAGGVEVRFELPPEGLPQAVGAASRAALRAAVARLLRDDTARHCWVTATREDGRVRLALRSDGAEPMLAEVTVP